VKAVYNIQQHAFQHGYCVRGFVKSISCRALHIAHRDAPNHIMSVSFEAQPSVCERNPLGRCYEEITYSASYARKLVQKYCPIWASLQPSQARVAFEWISHSHTSTLQIPTRSVPQSLTLFHFRLAGIRCPEEEIGVWGGGRPSFYAKRNCNANRFRVSKWTESRRVHTFLRPNIHLCLT
jgi:hypothetical protein